MKGRKKILLLALIAVATLVFSACSKTQTNNDFSVGGIVITDAEFFEISILVNGIKTDYSLDSSGCFNISHLKSGDVITFSKEGYSFNSYTVGGFSVDGIEIVGTKCRYDVLTFFDENYGTVSGGSILIRVDTLFTENGTYAFSVRATGDRPESEMSFAAEYTFKGTLSAPVAKIENGVLTVSHEKDVKFLVEINGVNVADKLDENKSLALSDVLENGTSAAKIKITAMLDGYKPSSVEIIYNEEE